MLLGVKTCSNSKSSWSTLAIKDSTFSSCTSFTHTTELQKNEKIVTKLHATSKGVDFPCALILGSDLFHEVDVILNFKEDSMSWENSFTLFKSASTLSSFDPVEIKAIDLDDPPAACKAENYYDRDTSSSTYSDKRLEKGCSRLNASNSITSSEALGIVGVQQESNI